MTTLADLIQNGFILDGRKLTELEKLEIAKQIAKCVEQAHKENKTLGGEFHPDSFEVDSKLKVTSKIIPTEELKNHKVRNEYQEALALQSKTKQSLQNQIALLYEVKSCIHARKNPFEIKKIKVQNKDIDVDIQDIERLLAGHFDKSTSIFGNSYSLKNLNILLKRIDNRITEQEAARDQINQQVDVLENFKKNYPNNYQFIQKPDGTITADIVSSPSTDIWFMGNILQMMGMPQDIYDSSLKQEYVRPKISNILENIDNSIKILNISIQERIDQIDQSKSDLKNELQDIILRNDSIEAQSLDKLLNNVLENKQKLTKYGRDEYPQVRTTYESLMKDPFDILSELEKSPIDLRSEKYASFVIQNYKSLKTYLDDSVREKALQKAENIDEARMTRELDTLIKENRDIILNSISRKDSNLNAQIEALKEKLSHFSNSNYKSIKDKYDSALLDIFSLNNSNEDTEQHESIAQCVLDNIQLIRQSFDDRHVSQLEEKAKIISDRKIAREAAAAAEKKRVDSLGGHEYILDIVGKYKPNEKTKETFSLLNEIVSNDSKLAIALYNYAANAKRKDSESDKSIVEYMIDAVNKRLLLEKTIESSSSLKKIPGLFSQIQDERAKEEALANKSEFLYVEGSLKADEKEPKIKALKKRFDFIRKYDNIVGSISAEDKSLSKQNLKFNDFDQNKEFTILSESEIKEKYWETYFDKNPQIKENIERNAIGNYILTIPRYARNYDQLKESILKMDPEYKLSTTRKQINFIALLQSHASAEKILIEAYLKNGSDENQKALADTIQSNKNEEENMMTKFDASFRNNLSSSIIDPQKLIDSSAIISASKMKFVKEERNKYIEDKNIEVEIPFDNFVTPAYVESQLQKMRAAIEQDPEYIKKRNLVRKELPGISKAYHDVEAKEAAEREILFNREKSLYTAAQSFFSLWKSSGIEGEDLVLNEAEMSTKQKEALLAYENLIVAYEALINKAPDSPNKTEAIEILSSLKDNVKILQNQIDIKASSVLKQTADLFSAALEKLKELATACFPGDRKKQEAVLDKAKDINAHEDDQKPKISPSSGNKN